MNGYRHSDAGFYPGKVGRKTGFQVVRTPKRGSNGLEDPKDFFLSDDEFESQETATTSPVKRLSMRYNKLKEFENSKLNSNSMLTPTTKITTAATTETTTSNTPLPPPSFSSPVRHKSNSNAEQQSSVSIQSPLSKLTEKVRNMNWLTKTASLVTPAEYSTPSKPNSHVQEKSEAEAEISVENIVAHNIESTTTNNNSNKDSNVQNLSDDEIDKEIERAADIGTPIQYKVRTLTSIMGSPGINKSQSEGHTIKTSSKLTKNIALNKNTKNSKFEDQRITNQVPEKKHGSSPIKLPVEPEKASNKVITAKQKKVKAEIPKELLRRSGRTRVAPIARWKNEKIVYKNEKINGVIVKTVKDILHTEEDYTPLHGSQNSQGKIDPTKKVYVDLSNSETVVNKRSRNSVKAKPTNSRSDTVQKKKPIPKKITEKVNEKELTKKPKVVKLKEPTNPKVLVQKEKKVVPEPPIVTKSTKRGLKRKMDTPETISKKQKAILEFNGSHDIDNVVDDIDIDNDNDINNDSGSDDAGFGDGEEKNDTPTTSWQRTTEKSLTLSIFEGPGTEKQVERTVAYAPNSYKNVTTIKSDEEYFKVGTLFDQDCEFCGGGIIELPAASKKAVKSNHDTYFIFYVICGTVEVTLSRNAFTVTQGCSFEIPMGNYYQFLNTGGEMAKMMFVQAKYVVIGDNNSDSESGSGSDETSDGN
ncbi:hypothetical protein C6P40_002542 [Pichia californica]|uniref:Mif2/CENP-C cupin domain-containing protein n=1 Tax=Pichia californica TaxID=460514 RepID=A0A9P7BEP8_9ASCO|nr:hypothetical protein C6P40_002542 [[Candida] californica]